MRSVLQTIAFTGLAGGTLLGSTSIALAQTGGSGNSDFPDLVPVAVWTGVVVVIALLLTSVGYLYRRRRGLDHPLHAPPIGADLEHGTIDQMEPTAGHAVTPHEVLEHTVTGASDAVEQAAVAHDEPH